MDCYLCGLPIPAKEALRGPEDELYVECEHILPVTEARWFLDLYMTNRLPTDEWTKKALELEYDQSHRVCNQAKSNFSFIRVDTNTGLPGITSVGIKKILKNIQSRAREHVSDYTGELRQRMTDIANRIQSREQAIRTRMEGILAHIQSQPAVKEPANEGMILLTRTALLADPGTLPSSLRQIHDEWYANTEKSRELRDKLFNTFVDETLALYPEIDPDNGLRETIDQTIVPPDVLTRALIKGLLQTFFTKYAAQETTPDPTGNFLKTTVLYGIYQKALEVKLSGPRTNADYPTICKLYDVAATYATQDPRITTILSPLSSLPSDIRTKCEIDKKNAEREERARRRVLQPTPDDVATTTLGDLKAFITTELKAEGLSGAEANRRANTLYTIARAAFLATYPEGIDRAKEVAAEEAIGPLALSQLSIPPTARRPQGVVRAEKLEEARAATILSRMRPPEPKPTLSDKIFGYILGDRPQPDIDPRQQQKRELVIKSGSPYGGATYRTPRRATSSLRTRRARHSGRSKKQRKRSSQKSRTGN
jgi:hypothetical protein